MLKKLQASAVNLMDLAGRARGTDDDDDEVDAADDEGLIRKVSEVVSNGRRRQTKKR